MKLQKRLGRIYRGKKYYKWTIAIQEDEIIDAGFSEGDELNAESEEGKVVLTKKD